MGRADTGLTGNSSKAPKDRGLASSGLIIDSVPCLTWCTWSDPLLPSETQNHSSTLKSESTLAEQTLILYERSIKPQASRITHQARSRQHDIPDRTSSFRFGVRIELESSTAAPEISPPSDRYHLLASPFRTVSSHLCVYTG